MNASVFPLIPALVTALSATALPLAAAEVPPDALRLPLRAQIISAPWESAVQLVDDYAETTYGQKWNFSDGKDTRIAEFGPGILDRRVADGKLNFRTGPDAWFSWGDFDGQLSKHRQEKFRWNHPAWSPGVLRLRLKQTLAQSRWSVAWGRTTELGHGKPESRQFEVKGTQWQTIEVKLGRRGEHFASWLTIATETPGNAVAIGEIGLLRPSEHAYYRCEINLPAPPVYGAIWYAAQPQYAIGVNGKVVHRWHGNGCGWWPSWIELTGHLRPGKNVLTFDCELIDWMGRENFLVAGGAVRCADGQIVRIASDQTWRVGRSPEKGWTDVGFDSSRWSSARPHGDAADARFPREVAASGGVSTMWRASLETGYQVVPPRHLGALEIACPGRPDPLFRFDEPVELALAAPLRRFDGKRYELSCRLYDSATRQFLRSVRPAALPDDAKHQRWQFRESGLGPGVYALYLDLLLDGKTEETAFLELVVCGPIGGRKVRGLSLEEGLELTRVDRIDCGSADDPHPRYFAEFVHPAPALPKPKIVPNPIAGSVLELAREYQWASYRVRFEDLRHPYLLRIAYPDSHPQVLGICIDAPFKPPQYGAILGSGAYTCRETPPSNTLKTFSTLVWPKNHDATLTLLNYHGSKPLLVQSVEILRIDNELPQLEIPHAARDRLFGCATERGTVLLTSFCQDPSGWRFEHNMQNCATTATLRHWYVAAENLIRWLKFTGQNAWCFNAHQYDQIYYPSELSDRFEKSAFISALPMLAKMFEVNGLKLFLGAEFMSARPIWQRDLYTDQEAAEGADTIKSISSQGRQMLHFAGAGSNYQHPAVEDAVVTMVHDLCAPLGAYPAFQGVHFMCGGYFAPGVFKLHRQFDLSKNSYDDTSIRRFEAFLGRKLPDCGSGREKFANRRAWIEKNALPAWIDWRCAAVTDLVRRCGQAATAVRDDLKCDFDWGDWSYGQARFQQWGEGRPYAQAAAQLGIDYRRLIGLPGTMHGPLLMQLGELVQGKDVIDGTYLAAQASQEIRGNFLSQAHSVYLVHPFCEARLTVPDTVDWPWHTGGICCYSPRPVGPDYLANYTRALIGGVPRVLWHGYSDVNHYSGGEQDLRAVARSYRSIPDGTFPSPDASIATKNVVVRTNAAGDAFLLLNPGWWDVECSLTLAGNTPRAVHLNQGKTYASPAVQIHLAPFAAESFRLEQHTKLTSAAGAVVDARPAKTFAQELQRLEAARDRLSAQAPASSRTIDLAVTLSKSLRTLVSQGAWGHAYLLTQSIEYRRLLDAMKKTQPP